ncbi:MAG: M14 family zinc carboxypeptidase [Vulcanimicrobiota bacterium]
MPYTLELNQSRIPVRQERIQLARRLDKDGDHFLSDQELRQQGRLLEEWKYALTDTRLPELSVYPSYQELGVRLQQLSTRPGYQLVSLGKTLESRDIWALRIGTEPEGRQPAVVVTGGTHAREWASLAVALQLAELATPQSDREIWIVPLVNPDGYEYSRQHDNSYRTNRNGVDLNRNYADADYPELYRRPEDTPGFDDDVGASDRPQSELYRGPHGASELEVQAMLNLELKRARTVAVLDNHGYGNWLLFPANASEEEYSALNARMNPERTYKFQSGAQLYTMTGNSMELLHAHHIKAMTLEVGNSFQPPAADLQELLKPALAANLAFIQSSLGVGLDAPKSCPDVQRLDISE